MARLPPLGPRIPRTGTPFSRALGRWTLDLLGWNVEGEFPNLPKLVLIAAPHTSNWDFIVGVAAKLALGLDVMWLGKDTLFRAPLGPLMRKLGGRPVDRTASHDVVKDVVDEFARRETMVLAIAPEGTRKRVDRWRTGFYHIANAARVPIVPVALNFGARAIQILPAFATTGDVDADIRALQQRFIEVRGRRER